MPSSSRKRNKGQARKARAKAATAAANRSNESEQRLMQINESVHTNGCDHGQEINSTPSVCSEFLQEYFKTMSIPRGTSSTVFEVVSDALSAAHSKFP